MAFEYHYISGDSHLEVDTAQWAAWVQAEYRERTPQLVHLEAGDGWYIDGKLARMGTAADVYGGKGRENYVPSGTVYEGTPGTGPASQRLQRAGPGRHRRGGVVPSPAGGTAALAHDPRGRRLPGGRFAGITTGSPASTARPTRSG